jgi:predicted TIM-barrel fold metal-dependent hydrolase
MPGTWDTIDRYMIISSDTHAGADLWDYKPYLDARWHDDFDTWAKGYSSPYDDLVTATATRNWDSDYRVSELEADGITAELVFPNTVPPFFNTIGNFATLPWTPEEFEQRWAGLQAHNRWLVDFCGKLPLQRRGIVQVFPHDVEKAIAEMRWAKETGVIAGILLPAIPPNHSVMPYHHPRYEPLWSAFEELDLPFHQHPGTGGPDVGADTPAAAAVMMFEFNHWTRRTLAHLVYAGVFERHPNLKAVWTENGTAWVLAELMMMDAYFSSMRGDNRTGSLFTSDVVNSLTLTPSEYFERQCYIGASFINRAEALTRYKVGVDKIMWGADYPHNEGTSPYSREAIRAAFYDVPEPEMRQMLAGNAARLYGFDLEALTPIAERVGPTVAEMHVPLDKVPADAESGAFAGVGEAWAKKMG